MYQTIKTSSIQKNTNLQPHSTVSHKYSTRAAKRYNEATLPKVGKANIIYKGTSMEINKILCKTWKSMIIDKIVTSWNRVKVFFKGKPPMANAAKPRPLKSMKSHESRENYILIL